jgi:hypothetical protein
MEVSNPLQIEDGKFEGCRLAELPLDDVRELARVGRGHIKGAAIRLVIQRRQRALLEQRGGPRLMGEG